MQLVLFHFVVTAQTLPSAVQVQPRTFLEMSPIYEELRPVYPHLARVACRFPTVSVPYCLNSNILLEEFSLTCKRFSCMESIQQENLVIWHLKNTLRKFSVRNLFHVTLLAPSIWTWLLDFCKTISYTFLVSHTVLCAPPINFTVQKVYHQRWNYFESLLPHIILAALVRQKPKYSCADHMYENRVPSTGITFKPKSVNSIKTLKMGYVQTDRQTDRQRATQGNTAWISHNYTSVFPMGSKQATRYLHVPFRD
jgi:hypothetical protein